MKNKKMTMISAILHTETKVQSLQCLEIIDRSLSLKDKMQQDHNITNNGQQRLSVNTCTVSYKLAMVKY